MVSNTLGRFRIIRELARSNDIVYEAVDEKGRRVALKELQMPANLAGQPRQERIERFTREARAAAGLQHPNIVRIIDHNQVQGRYYIAMEFLEGQSLREELRQKGVLPLAEVVRIGCAVADGLAFAHKRGVVHRDIKPDNVHLEPDRRVVITDFGIARLTFEPTLTAEGQVFGTPSYMSPEQILGKGIDARTDLFSLGVMLYEMATGKKPFVGDSVVTITYNIMHVDAPPASGIPSGMDNVIRRAMSKDPSTRYPDARQLSEDLRAVGAGQAPPHASRMPPVQSIRQPEPQNGSPLQARPPMGRPVAVAPVAAPPSRPMGRVATPSAPPRPAPMAYPTGMPRPGGYAAAGAGSMPPPGQPPIHGPGTLPPSAQPSYSPPDPSPAIRRTGGGGEARWLLGWLGVVLILGVLIVVVTWLTVTSMDRFQAKALTRTTNVALNTAHRAFQSRQFDLAAEKFQEAVRTAAGSDRGSALQGAAWSIAEMAQARLGNGSTTPDRNSLAAMEEKLRYALRLNSNSPAAYLALGRVQTALGQVDDADASLDQAAALAKRALNSGDPNTVNEGKSVGSVVQLWKADLHYRKGVALARRDPAAARQEFMIVIQVAPNTEFAQRAQQAIQQLSGLGGADPQGSGPAGFNNWNPGYMIGNGQR